MTDSNARISTIIKNICVWGIGVLNVVFPISSTYMNYQTKTQTTDFMANNCTCDKKYTTDVTDIFLGISGVVFNSVGTTALVLVYHKSKDIAKVITSLDSLSETLSIVPSIMTARDDENEPTNMPQVPNININKVEQPEPKQNTPSEPENSEEDIDVKPRYNPKTRQLYYVEQTPRVKPKK